MNIHFGIYCACYCLHASRTLRSYDENKKEKMKVKMNERAPCARHTTRGKKVDDIHGFDADIKKLENWTDDENRMMKPETLKRTSNWVHEIARAYRTKYREPIPPPCPLPCSPDEINVEWMKGGGIIFAGNDTADYYGRNDLTGDEIHGHFPLDDGKKDEIIEFLHDHVSRNHTEVER